MCCFEVMRCRYVLISAVVFDTACYVVLARALIAALGFRRCGACDRTDSLLGRWIASVAFMDRFDGSCACYRWLIRSISAVITARLLFNLSRIRQIIESDAYSWLIGIG
jgi:hypothetical protein